MKKVLATLLVFFLFTVGAFPVAARTPENVINKKFLHASESGKMEKKEKRMEKVADNLQERAQKEINRRIESLEKLIAKITDAKKLSDEQKQALTTQAQTEITNLKTLLEKINATTDPETLKTDVKSIVQSYRIYALFIPKMQILGSADRIFAIADQLTKLADKIQSRLTEAQSNGKDVTELQKLLTDMKAKIVDAKTKAQTAIDIVTPLAPDGYPGNKEQLKKARDLIRDAQRELLSARFNAQRIIVRGIIHRSKNITPAPTASASPTLTPSSTL